MKSSTKNMREDNKVKAEERATRPKKPKPVIILL